RPRRHRRRAAARRAPPPTTAEPTTVASGSRHTPCCAPGLRPPRRPQPKPANPRPPDPRRPTARTMRAMFLLRFDMRAPTDGPADIRDLYQAAIEMAVWGETHGAQAVVVSEH